MAFSGSCHCGALHYDCALDPTGAMSCNCSICRRKGALLHFVQPSEVRMTADPDALGIYRFHRAIIAHHFCRTCGISIWAEVTPPDGGRVIAINLRSSDLDLTDLPVQPFDGASL